MNTPLVLHCAPLPFSFATRFPLFRFGVTIIIPWTFSIPEKAGANTNHRSSYSDRMNPTLWSKTDS